MNRRGFLRSALAAATAPAWLSSAFAAPSQAGVAALGAAWQRARAEGRPLLVLLIPVSEQRWFRGEVLGAWINYGDAHTMAMLGATEVVCASAEDLQALLPGAPIEPHTWMVLADPSAIPARSEVINLDIDSEHPLPPGAPAALAAQAERPDWSAEEGYERWEQAVTALSERQCALLTERLGEALPAALRREIHEQGEEALASEAIAALRDHAPAGVHWAQSGGCGTYIEDIPDYNSGIMCGMGHVAARTRRFLYFFPVDSGM